MKAWVLALLLSCVAAERRKAVVNQQWVKEQSEKLHGTTTEPLPGPWIRTIYGTQVEVVTPYPVGGIVFATKPPETDTSMQPWITLKNDGSPKTVNPKLKNGKVANGFPDVGTYFQTATTITHQQEDLQAHNLKEDETFDETKMIEEDDTYVSLSPLMRCTPKFYFKRGIAKSDTSEPFCYPHDHEKFRVGKTYFMTWFSRYFEGAEKVRIHYAYIRETSRNKGFDRSFKKREVAGFLNADIHGNPKKDLSAELDALDSELSFKGAIPGAFYTSDWVDNQMGFFPIEVQEEWLQGEYYKRVLMAIQPDTVSDEDFDLMSSAHLYGNFQITESIGKNTKEMRKLRDQTGNDDDFYYIIIAIPTIVAITVFFVYVFVIINKNSLDLSHIKKPKRSRYGNHGKYDLPIAMTDVHKPQGFKTS